MNFQTTFTLIALLALSVSAFTPTSLPHRISNIRLQAKGFGKAPEPKKEKSEGQIKREQKAEQYDKIAAAGGQEYSIYVRQFGSDDKSWLACGAIAVPRGEQVARVIFETEVALKEAIGRTYPKLRGSEQEFEYGSNLKVYPDDPIEVAVNRGARKEGFSVGNWVNNLLSPIDASQATPPTPPPPSS
mmetsp:Transcript_39064/g.44550  ORF Transcript_39064/g.44550 Transcript_39064/m.44550 type:complete len:187 (+) Transcript_39064:53-613(+)|eukprot:CAMPEP_0194145834 /NCGR_PEP_ID=MMETSP0152-20130528/18858_1 /TAXON_ID=1049557 /ORGANISM="Thalassiothrix antarctica, Strain L6-D1" /LENGTH=186 /DNA_ID=CAMNT_0038846181 /DNA_START=30 /DNA_END=590 /DNA_ORIENTATION=-